MRKVAYLTDIEGQWDKLEDFCAGSSLVRLEDPAGARSRLVVADDAVFVFGGDAIDRGPAGRKIVATLLAARRAQPDSVVLLAGNRDINKLRLARELDGSPPPRALAAVTSGRRGDLLRFILTHTMGARAAFDHRRDELAAEGSAAADDDVVQSYLDDLAPGGAMRSYLSLAVLAHREDETLFVHGGVTPENMGVVPGHGRRIPDVDDWLRALNEFYAQSMHAFCTNMSSADGTPMWQELIAYQSPKNGSRTNQASVVYARPTDAVGNPMLPPPHVVSDLAAAELRRVVVGHTPSGDCPALLRDDTGFELLLADNSYGRVERGSRVTIAENVVRVVGTTELDSGVREAVDYDAPHAREAPAQAAAGRSFLGLREVATGRLVKARLARGDYLLYRGFEGYRVEQIAVSEAELAATALVAPRAAS